MSAPEPGFMIDSKGRHCPVELIKPIDLARDELVRSLTAKAKAFSTKLALLKREVTDDLQAFVELSAEQYRVEIGGHKGNLTLYSFDGRYKLQRQISDRLVFDERLQVAKELVDQCVRDWSSEARPEVRVLIEHAFQTDREGKISTERVLGLRKLTIEDERWGRAMQAISDSLTVANTKSYVRFYERSAAGGWLPISLDITTLEPAPTGAEVQHER